MSLEKHIHVNIEAWLTCAACGDVYLYDGTEEHEVVDLVLKDAEHDGWEVIDGNVLCHDCVIDNNLREAHRNAD